MASVDFLASGARKENRKGGIDLIHCGSSVIRSPGVTSPLSESRGFLVGRGLSPMPTSPSESREASSE